MTAAKCNQLLVEQQREFVIEKLKLRDNHQKQIDRLKEQYEEFLARKDANYDEIYNKAATLKQIIKNYLSEALIKYLEDRYSIHLLDESDYDYDDYDLSFMDTIDK